ncbi:Protein kinase-like domain protein [Akanthomyces lecanii RCEF 1005]|uniref:Protein kinase-like domain protein n=1 Tax=Akanthomyces lecanii RCEF 1005 TaxID=1081108 RepID=A0A162K9J3_CORDF|nr:Protein kinase-like domain protein [Akanthomyces lecanii RCEF 1005]
MDRTLAHTQKRIDMEKAEASASDASESEEDVTPGVEILYKSGKRKVVLGQGQTVVKSGAEIRPAEAAALRFASGAGIPAPLLHDVFTDNGIVAIRMEYVPGQTLDKLWPSMSLGQKRNIADQLHQILKQMRELEPPPNYIGCCDGTGIRDTRVRFTYYGPVCNDEVQFNEYLESTLFRQISSMLRTSLRGQLRTGHRIVFTHGDLAPRNIVVQDGRISGIVDWEESGWYPEYWELVKFFERPTEGDWKEYADAIFPTLYPAELVTYTAMSKWRHH